MVQIRIEPYNPEWVTRFNQIEAELRDLLQGVDIVAIEHVGSTSVPGLAAKAIIDVDVIVKSNEAIAKVQRLLEGSGHYKYLGEMGIPDRHGFRALTGPSRNVYACLDNCLAVRNHMGIRKVLRENEELRTRYSKLKLRLAEREWESMAAYTEEKTTFLLTVLEHCANITDAERAQIRLVNAQHSAAIRKRNQERPNCFPSEAPKVNAT